MKNATKKGSVPKFPNPPPPPASKELNNKETVQQILNLLRGKKEEDQNSIMQEVLEMQFRYLRTNFEDARNEADRLGNATEMLMKISQSIPDIVFKKMEEEKKLKDKDRD